MKIKRKTVEKLVVRNRELEELARLRFILKDISSGSENEQELMNVSLEEWGLLNYFGRLDPTFASYITGTFTFCLQEPEPTGYEQFLASKYTGASSSPEYRDGIAAEDEIDAPWNIIRRVTFHASTPEDGTDRLPATARDYATVLEVIAGALTRLSRPETVTGGLTTESGSQPTESDPEPS